MIRQSVSGPGKKDHARLQKIQPDLAGRHGNRPTEKSPRANRPRGFLQPSPVPIRYFRTIAVNG
jgi:hypothetical protein